MIKLEAGLEPIISGHAFLIVGINVSNYEDEVSKQTWQIVSNLYRTSVSKHTRHRLSACPSRL